MLGGGALLLALALVLRRDKARADRFLARGTGRIWFEVKVLLALLALLLLPWGELSSWSSETPVASYTCLLYTSHRSHRPAVPYDPDRHADAGGDLRGCVQLDLRDLHGYPGLHPLQPAGCHHALSGGQQDAGLFLSLIHILPLRQPLPGGGRGGAGEEPQRVRRPVRAAGGACGPGPLLCGAGRIRGAAAHLDGLSGLLGPLPVRHRLAHRQSVRIPGLRLSLIHIYSSMVSSSTVPSDRLSRTTRPRS